MNYKEENISKRVQEHYNYVQEKGYEIVFVAHQGSWNYGLGYEGSDVDTKAIILPSFEDIVYNREPISTTLVLENNEHIDLKDIRVMFENYKKQNINFIETLFSKYIVVNGKYGDLIDILFQKREEIARLNYNQALRCIAGMSMEKLKALQHPYPTIIDKIEKFGYDPKQLHHILRMNDFIKKYIAGKSYATCLIPDNKEYLIDIKKGVLNCETAVELARKTDEETYNLKEQNLLEQDAVNKEAIDILNQVKLNILKRKFKEDISKC